METAESFETQKPASRKTLADSGVLTMARLTFKEAFSRRIVLIAVLMGLLFLLVFGIGFHFIRKDYIASTPSLNRISINGISNFMTMAGLYVINFLTIAMAVLISVDTISGEVASGTIHTLVSKPIRRWEIVAGKWLGFSLMLLVYLLLMAGGVMAIIWAIGGYISPHPWQGLALLWLNAVLMMSISLLGGTYLSTLANGVLVFGLFGIAFVGGWIEQIGGFMEGAVRQTTSNIGIITSLLIPSEAIWKRVVYEIQSPLMSAMEDTPFTTGSAPSSLMVAYALLYTLGVILLAIRKFSQRDL